MKQSEAMEKWNFKVITTTISSEFHDLAKQHNIKWSDALRRGLAFEFGDRGLSGYENRITLHGKLMQTMSELGNLTRLLETVIDRVNKLEKQNGS